MPEATIVAVLSLVGTCVGSIAGIIASNKLTDFRLKKLEEKVDKHNQVIERTYKLEECTELLGERIKVANHRIDDLEHKN